MLSEADLLRFTSKIEYTDTCWLWRGTINKQGYGSFYHTGTNVTVQRVALELHLGRSLLPGMQAAHAHHDICGNRNCVNPQHLREATRKENQADRIVDGTTNRGRRCKTVKLNEEQVFAIRADPRAQRVIAKEYGIAQHTVSDIKTGKRWAWLTIQSSGQAAE